MTAVEDYLQPEGGWRQPVETRLPPPPPSQRGVAFRAISGVSRLFGREELPRIFPVLNTIAEVSGIDQGFVTNQKKTLS